MLVVGLQLLSVSGSPNTKIQIDVIELYLAVIDTNFINDLAPLYLFH